MIRLFHPNDLAAVKEVFKENVPAFFALEELNDLLIYLEKYQNTYFVVDEKDEILGCGGYHFSEKGVARLSWDFFRKSAKGKGFGRKLIQHCLDEIAEVDAVKEIQVWTSQHAFRFYAKFDFETVEVKKDYWAEGLDLYLMRKERKE